ncbi:MAG: DJ-1/PfpI family protein [Verrucomicrobiota bacterium]
MPPMRVRFFSLLALLLLSCLPAAAADRAPAQDVPPLTLGVLLFPGFELLDAYGPLELWGNLKPQVRIVTIAAQPGPVPSAQGPETVATHGLQDAPALDLLLVPGGFGAFKALKDETLLAWLRGRSRSARVTMSVCNGASILAAAGLLDGRPATTNKAYWKAATRPGPKVQWVPQARWVDDGDIVTSSGVSAGIDMTLHVISRLYTTRLAEKMADQIEHEWHRDPAWDPFAAKHGLVPEKP